MEIKYTFLKDETICIFQYNKVFDIQRHFNFAAFRYSLQNPPYSQIEFTIVDLRKGIMSFPSADLKQMSGFREKEIKNNSRIIYLVSTPRVTAFIHIYCQRMQEIGFDYTYCSTMTRICELTNYKLSESELEHALNNLDFSY